MLKRYIQTPLSYLYHTRRGPMLVAIAQHRIQQMHKALVRPGPELGQLHSDALEAAPVVAVHGDELIEDGRHTVRLTRVILLIELVRLDVQVVLVAHL